MTRSRPGEVRYGRDGAEGSGPQPVRRVRQPGRLRTATVAAAALAVSAIAVAGATPVGAAPARVSLPGALALLPPGAQVGQALPASQVVDVDVALALPDPAALSAFVTEVSTPGSPGYRQYLAPGQFATRFGPGGPAIAAVRSWLAGAGLTVGPTSGDGLLVPARGPAPTVAGVFGTSLDSVRLASGAQGYTDTATPSVPSALAGAIRDVVGLDDLGRWHSDLVKADSSTARASSVGTGSSAAGTAGAVAADAVAPQACSAASALAYPGGPLTFDQVAGAYDMSSLFSEGRTGAGVTVALYELEPFDLSDIQAFERCYGIDTSVRTVAVDGGAGTGPGSGEAALDIEDVAALAPGADVVVYEGPNDSTTGPIDTFDQIAADDQAQVVSTSWGQCEAENTPANGGNAPVEAEIFAEMAAQGQTMLAASGDSGSEGCWDATHQSPSYDTATTLAVDDPASQPDVTGVGGTTLPSTTPSGQTVWNACDDAGTTCAGTPGAGASGGGISSVWAMPSWQQGVVGALSSGSPCGQPSGSYCREVPDVVADADPDTGYPIYWDGRWSVVGGTSTAAPLWAALTSLADQGCAATVGFADPALYALGAAGAAVFHDVTVGNNDLTDSHGGDYPASMGYDMATGWGSPDGAALVRALQPAGGCPVVIGLSSSAGPLAGGSTLTVTGIGLGGATSVDFGPSRPATILSDSATSVTVTVPSATYSRSVFVTVTTPAGTSAATPTAKYAYGTPRTGQGYWEVASDGGIFSFGNAQFYGSMGGQPLNEPIVGMAATPDDGGYWEVASDGGIFSFGNAQFYGSMGGQPLNEPIVGMAATPDDGGYWEVASDGGIFSFGNAQFYGSMGGQPLNEPIVGIAPTPTGGGYWEVASDGGIFSFGNAQFYGSMGGQPLNEPVVGIAPTPTGVGYWEVASDGGIFSFGNAQFYGSMGGVPLNRPVVGGAATPTGVGYWEVASDGGIFSFGEAAFFGSTGSLHLVAPVVGMAIT